MQLDNETLKEDRRLIYLNESIFSLLVKTSIPTIIGMLIMVIYNLTDTFFVGLLHDSSMIAAIGVVFSFVSVIQGIGFLFGYGSGNRMSKKIGENNIKEAEQISSLGLVIAIITGVILSFISYFWIDSLVKIIAGSASINLLNFTKQYLKIIVISIPFSLYSITLYNQLRLCGNVKDGVLGLLVGMISNVVLDPILMFGFSFGFIGIGYATLIGQIIGCIALSFLANKHENIIGKLKDAKWNKEKAYHIFIGGTPNFSRQSITSIALVLLNRVGASYGDDMIAALTISSRIVAFVFLLMIGWSQGFQPICAMNFGAKKYDRIKSAFKITVSVGTVFLILSSILIYIFSDSLIKTMSKDTEVIYIGSQMLKAQCISLPFLSYIAVSSMYMQNIGKYFWSLLISISRQGIFYIPLLYLLTHFYQEAGIYWLQPISDIFTLILTIIVVNNNNFHNSQGII